MNNGVAITTSNYGWDIGWAHLKNVRERHCFSPVMIRRL